MKTRTILLAVIVLLTVVVASALLIVNNIKTSAIPDYAEQVDLDNLSEEVYVYRDSLAIPHIYAKNEQDLYTVVGYLTAQDRLWQMDLLRRITTGRLSEIFGADMIETDQLFRAFNFTKKSVGVLEKTSPEIKLCLDAYTKGVNQFIRTHKKKLPFEFRMLGYEPEEWSNINTINLIGYMAWDLTSGWTTDMAIFKLSQAVEDSLLQELLPWDGDFSTDYIYPEYMHHHADLLIQTSLNKAVEKIQELGIQVFSASNNWAVSGEHSESGMPLLANDMHLGFMSPGIWYQMHHVIEGELNVTGVVLPGQPYVIAGHNEDIAWGMTNITIDNMDFYLETLNPADSNQYKLNGRWVDMLSKEEEIFVKGEEEAVIKTNRFTHRGPVVSSFKGFQEKTISARWLGTEYSNELRTVHLFNRAKNWNDFRKAAKTFIAVSQNVVYADKKGNIGLQAAGGVPMREGNHVLMYPGDTTLYDWTGIVPFEEMPYSYNPESGMVSSANNKTVNEDYPYYIGTWYSLPNRVDRIRELLGDSIKHNKESFKKIHSDQLSVFARRMTPLYIEALAHSSLNEKEEAALKELKNWDYQMQSEAAAPLIYEQMFSELIQSIYKDELGEKLFSEIQNNNVIPRYHIYKLAESNFSLWCDDVSTPNVQETFEDNIKTAFINTIDTLSAQLGPDVSAWKYGDLHQITIMHPMGSVNIINKIFKPNLGPYRIGGSFHTVAPFSYPVGKSWEVNHGASQRHIYNTADWDKSETVIPTGTSGIPASPYYGNQTDLYMNFEYHADYFSKEMVKKHAKYEAKYW